MKNQQITLVIGLFLCALLTIFSCTEANNAKDTVEKVGDQLTETVKPPAPKSSRTGLVISNTTAKDMEVAVVLAALGGGCDSLNPPVTADQLQKMGFCTNVINAGSGTAPYAGKCTFTLAANSKKVFPNIPNTCISGNITFGGYPACPDKTFPQGYTTAEFTINPTAGAEAFDISMVNGYNYDLEMNTSGGGTWTYSPNNKPITAIANKGLGKNIGNPGIYPKNCTDCIGLVGSPVCPGYPTKPTCQKTRICNVQRGFDQSGGTITIVLK